MKLAQALKKRKAMRLMVSSLATQITRSAYDPEAKPEKLVNTMLSVSPALITLDTDIAAANAANKVPFQGQSLTLSQAKGVRDQLVKCHEAYMTVAQLDKSQVIRGGATRDENDRVVRTPDSVRPVQVDTDKMFQIANQAARDARELDALLQAANWSVEVSGDAETT